MKRISFKMVVTMGWSLGALVVVAAGGDTTFAIVMVGVSQVLGFMPDEDRMKRVETLMMQALSVLMDKKKDQ